MTPLPRARTTHARRTLPARWFTGPLVALALLGCAAVPASAAPADDAAGQQSYAQNETEPAVTDPSAREGELPPYDARDAQQAVDDMVMDEEAAQEEEAEGAEGAGRHCPTDAEDRAAGYERWGTHRDDAYPRSGGDGQDTPARPAPGQGDDAQIVG
ncbi:hypothetical protein ABR738_17645 [Streptomyces sp. Edi4]|uniref:hypothetical protein n=1 Tax=Streptomyces sp. Edi4 TaxID=3162527 RepID=UPI0033067478